jgi:ubiquinone/menaquinone biosynthesis C-methylase UbiE
MPNLQQRSYEAELIDDFSLSNDALRQNLEELAIINRWLGGNEVTLAGLKKLKHKFPKNEALSIADLGAGGGDMLALMARWCSKQQVDARLVGVDANDFMIKFGQDNTKNYPQISYIHEDIFAESFIKQRFDVVTMTLFCHHFTDEQLIQLFSQLKTQARIGFVINDLHRHWFAYWSIAWLTRFFSKSYLVKNDAKLSVWRGFSRKELEQILQKAGHHHYTIRWRWAFRWEVVVEC